MKLTVSNIDNQEVGDIELAGRAPPERRGNSAPLEIRPGRRLLPHRMVGTFQERKQDRSYLTVRSANGPTFLAEPQIPAMLL